MDGTTVSNVSTPFTVVANSSRVVVRFASNGSNNNYLPGFYAIYDVEHRTYNCDGIYNETNGGVITSPNWPLSQFDQLDCRYSINVPNGYRAVLTFEEIRLATRPQNTDFIEVIMA